MTVLELQINGLEFATAGMVDAWAVDTIVDDGFSPVQLGLTYHKVYTGCFEMLYLNQLLHGDPPRLSAGMSATRFTLSSGLLSYGV